MEDTTQTPDISQDNELMRDDKGRFKLGHPAILPERKITWQSYPTRIEYLLGRYSRAELQALALDSKQLGKMSSLDASLIELLALSPANADGMVALKWVMEQLIGKPLQRSEFSGPNGGPIDHADVTAARDLLLRGAVSVAAPAGATGADGPAQTPPATKSPV